MTTIISCVSSTNHTGLEVMLNTDGSIKAVRCKGCNKMLSTEVIEGVPPNHEHQEVIYEKYEKEFLK